ERRGTPQPQRGARLVQSGRAGDAEVAELVSPPQGKHLGRMLAAAVLGLVALPATGCAPTPRLPPTRAPTAAVPARRILSPDCKAPGWEQAAQIDTSSLRGLYWAPFGRDDVRLRVYAPTIAREIGVDCPAQSTGFARALAAWQDRQGFPASGLLSEFTFIRMKGVLQSRRPFVLL